MSSNIIDGKGIAKEIRGSLAAEVEEIRKGGGRAPGLAVVLVGDDPASAVYVRSKGKACEGAGINSFQHLLPETTTEEELLTLIDDLNGDDAVDGILVQLPLPPHFNEERIIESITPEKDVDGFHPYNVGRLTTGNPTFSSCTPYGVMKLLEREGVEISGKDAVIVGRSNIVGKPMALMLLAESATVTICHSRTKDLEAKVRGADIVVAAVGIAEFVKGEWVKDGAIVIDVGINRVFDGDDDTKGRLVGDVEFEGAAGRASLITPVPGGVGPMTIAMLLYNTVQSCKKRG